MSGTLLEIKVPVVQTLVCYTAVFRVVTQRSSPLRGGALRQRALFTGYITVRLNQLRYPLDRDLSGG